MLKFRMDKYFSNYTLILMYISRNSFSSTRNCHNSTVLLGSSYVIMITFPGTLWTHGEYHNLVALLLPIHYFIYDTLQRAKPQRFVMYGSSVKGSTHIYISFHRLLQLKPGTTT